MSSTLRAIRIARVLLRHRLDSLLEDTAFGKWLWLLKPFTPARSEEANLPRGERLRLALQELGPIFVKFGQILSTRRDLMPPDIADELAKLRDQVAPFAGATAKNIIETQLGKSIGELFASFDETPLASASIAQVHPATLHNGKEVVVKVLRPGIAEQIKADIGLLRHLANFADRHHPNAEKIRPQEVVDEIDSTLQAELDLQREGSNASYMRRLWKDSDDLYVPEVFWDYSRENVLTLERVSGVGSDDVVALTEAGVDLSKLAAKGVRLFYTQVFRDNFFHADAHSGNIWVDATRKDNPRYIALDFGIVGQLQQRDQYYLAENFMAMFKYDYRRIAELHVQAGWMPSNIRIDELEAAIRAVCEPYFTRPLSEISLAEVLVKIFRTAQRYELTVQPQLILLQKTLLNIEGVARQLDPKLDLFAVAKPVLETILRERYSPATLMSELQKRMPEIISQAPDMPRLIRNWFAQQVNGEHSLKMHSDELAELSRLTVLAQFRLACLVLASGFLICAALFYLFDTQSPVYFHLNAKTWVALGAGVFAMLAAWFKRA
ncbi:MAG TPA: ubiquinone biosynthesis regulatory protein kinase UbiB [Arenimonas sp.]|nr:ubiquinone biosynthesis regulatory protein kinase UbiB [Arenimonas sp.]HPO23811.1 ubiquinone biosynthesis regulatory protein kinase UbiB [Arenimonas sp.]